MDLTFNEQQKEGIMVLKKAIRNGVSMALLNLDKPLRTHLVDNCILSGGCTWSIHNTKIPNDWDLLFKSQRESVSFLQYIQGNKSDVLDVSPQYVTATTGTKVITANAVTLKNNVQVIDFKWQRQNFDFVHCMPYYDIKEDKFHISYQQYDAIVNNRLLINPLLRTTLDEKRLQKWTDRGLKYERNTNV
jgi:hypothetical protein